MKTSMIQMLMLTFIQKGLKINTIRAKMRRFASQSVLCKMYHKLVKGAVKLYYSSLGFYRTVDGSQLKFKTSKWKTTFCGESQLADIVGGYIIVNGV